MPSETHPGELTGPEIQEIETQVTPSQPYTSAKTHRQRQVPSETHPGELTGPEIQEIKHRSLPVSHTLQLKHIGRDKCRQRHTQVN